MPRKRRMTKILMCELNETEQWDTRNKVLCVCVCVWAVDQCVGMYAGCHSCECSREQFQAEQVTERSEREGLSLWNSTDVRLNLRGQCVCLCLPNHERITAIHKSTKISSLSSTTSRSVMLNFSPSVSFEFSNSTVSLLCLLAMLMCGQHIDRSLA